MVRILTLRAGALLIAVLALSVALFSSGAGGDDTKKDKNKKDADLAAKWRKQGVWADARDSTIPADFAFQGEYVTADRAGEKVGVQVIALDKRHFQAVVYPGGLPGAGWDRKNRSLMDGTLSEDRK